ncbi:Uncharacterised protein [Mycobacteroides abscessus subsp. abscessus]|nr:Uncharacterised protein [Mycobacteroides abscessus subsp. abscessus]
MTASIADNAASINVLTDSSGMRSASALTNSKALATTHETGLPIKSETSRYESPRLDASERAAL